MFSRARTFLDQSYVKSSLARIGCPSCHCWQPANPPKAERDRGTRAHANCRRQKQRVGSTIGVNAGVASYAKYLSTSTWFRRNARSDRFFHLNFNRSGAGRPEHWTQSTGGKQPFTGSGDDPKQFRGRKGALGSVSTDSSAAIRRAAHSLHFHSRS